MQELFPDNNEQFVVGFASLEDYLVEKKRELWLEKNDTRRAIGVMKAQGFLSDDELLVEMQSQFEQIGINLDGYRQALEAVKTGDNGLGLALLQIDIEFWRRQKEWSIIRGNELETEAYEQKELLLTFLYEDVTGRQPDLD